MADKEVTSAINHYDGIFKFIHFEKAKPSFLQARKLLSEKKMSEAIEKFHESLQQCENDSDKITVSLVIEECKRYVENMIPPNAADGVKVKALDWNDIAHRKVEKFEEFHDNLPQGVFMMKLSIANSFNKVVIFGRKTLSDLWTQNLIPEIFCSQIREDMLLGLLSDWRMCDESIIAYFHPFSAIEKRIVFANAISDLAKDPSSVDLVYPFPLLPVPARKELTSPAEGWDVDETYYQNLSHGETHIREVTVDVLRELNLTSHRLYDPACSTGVFLHSLKQAFPACETIGQDLSQKMCNVARARVDQVHWGNAMSPKIDAGSADCVFVRFLNSEVVTTKEAKMLLEAVLPTVAIGGIMIVFGHTPVLLSGDDFRSLAGFNLIRTVAVTKDTNSMFQYYIIRRCE